VAAGFQDGCITAGIQHFQKFCGISISEIAGSLKAECDPPLKMAEYRNNFLCSSRLSDYRLFLAVPVLVLC
jgi:hypothetical protein